MEGRGTAPIMRRRTTRELSRLPGVRGILLENYAIIDASEELALALLFLSSFTLLSRQTGAAESPASQSQVQSKH